MAAVRLDAHRQGRCDCETWGLLSRARRDLILAGFMEWARLFHDVRLKLLACGDHVAIGELVTVRHGMGRARRVMTELCAWADCARVTLELTPSDHSGAGVRRLAVFFLGLGFEANREGAEQSRAPEGMIRHPARLRPYWVSREP